MKAKEWQDQFALSLFEGLSEPLAETFIQRGRRQKQQRFAIYQNNVFYSLTQALGDLYPTIKLLVGDDFFNGTASVYIRNNPPKQAAMVHFGNSFPDFLANFEHTQSMPYLADVALLELKRHHAYHAEDEVALPPEYFADIAAEVFECAKVKLHDSFKYLHSNYAIFSIWQANNSGSAIESNIEIDEPEFVLIVRKGYELQVFNVDQGTFRFYYALHENSSIEDAAQFALENGHADIAAAISLGIQQGFFSQLIIPK